MYQASGDWKKALEIAEKHDRINLLSTYYKLGRTYEISQEYAKAVEYFEKSGTFAKEVPRMYLEAGELERLEDYVEQKRDKGLYRWWANYLESQNRFDIALKYYKLSEDF
jgi:intraflagellar transport protein 140